MVKTYATVKVGDPMAEGTLMGPMHNTIGLREYEEGLKKIVA
jgi:hypothetical protein